MVTTKRSDKNIIKSIPLGGLSRDFNGHVGRTRLIRLMLLGGTIIVILLLATFLTPLLGKHTLAIFPFSNTDLALLFYFSIITFVAYGFIEHQRKKVMTIGKELKAHLEESTERVQRDNSRLYALMNVSRIMSMKTTLQGVFDCITKTCVEAFDCHQVSLMLHDEQAGELVVRSASGHADTTKVLGVRQKIGVGISGWVAENRQALILGNPDDLIKYPQLEFKSDSIAAAMVAPIILRDELVGILNVSSRSKNITYDKEDLRALRVFTENAATCIRHIEQASWMRHTIENLRCSLAQTEQPKKDEISKQSLKGQIPANSGSDA